MPTGYTWSSADALPAPHIIFISARLRDSNKGAPVLEVHYCNSIQHTLSAFYNCSTSRLEGTQNKKEYAYNQSYARTCAALPDMEQTEKERGESHEWALMFMLPV